MPTASAPIGAKSQTPWELKLASTRAESADGMVETDDPAEAFEFSDEENAALALLDPIGGGSDSSDAEVSLDDNWGDGGWDDNAWEETDRASVNHHVADLKTEKPPPPSISDHPDTTTDLEGPPSSIESALAQAASKSGEQRALGLATTLVDARPRPAAAAAPQGETQDARRAPTQPDAAKAVADAADRRRAPTQPTHPNAQVEPLRAEAGDVPLAAIPGSSESGESLAVAAEARDSDSPRSASSRPTMVGEDPEERAGAYRVTEVEPERVELIRVPFRRR